MNPLIEIGIIILALFAIIIVASFIISVIITPLMVFLVDRGSKKDAAEIYELLPKKDCGKCGCETCMAYALKIADMRSKPYNCDELDEETREKIAKMFRREEKPGEE